MKFADGIIVKRLRWVMAGEMLFGLLNTIAGQPKSFWLHPETAIRGDGLSIHDPVNRTFEFFLGHGWLPCVAAYLIYVALALVLVSSLPTRPALMAILSVIFGHFYGSTNWLAVRWHLGFTGVGLHAAVVGAALAFAAAPLAPPLAATVAHRLRWLMLGVMLIDPLVTLIGQPGSYWLHPETVHEGNPMWRWVMQQGWFAYVLGDSIYCAGAFWLASSLPRLFSWICMWGFIFSHFVGASNWLFYEWRLGMEAPVIYGIAISAGIVWWAPLPTKESATNGLRRAPVPKACF